MGTDMSKHGASQNELKEIAKAASEERDLAGKNKQTLLRAVVHAADISNPTKPFDISVQWSERIIKEFFSQGDKERELGFPITMLCDRHTVNFSDSQSGFINFVIKPYFTVVSDLIPNLKFTTEICSENVTKFVELKEEMAEEMKNGNKKF